MNLEALSMTTLVELNEVCEAFEEAWKTGARPRIENYLGSSAGEKRLALFQMLLEVELELRVNDCERPDPAEYLPRFEPFADVIRSVFDRMVACDDTEPLEPLTTEPAPGDLDEATVPDTTLSTPSATPPAPVQDGQHVTPEFIGRYCVERLLAQGNFLVYLARDPTSGRKVAIKIARPGDSAGRRRIMSLAEEAKKLDELHHPRIVKMFEYVPGGGDRAPHDGFIVLECIEGKTLEALLQESRPPARRLAAIIALVADAVHHAHTHKPALVHRDLKPSNILLDQDGDPHVCDFGLAVDEEIQERRRREVAGTLHYMAPEQVRGETHRLDGRTDIWALGVILYRGLTGRLPFPGRNPDETFDEILHRDPRPPRMAEPGVDPELERICLRCLSRQMGERYLTAADLAADLEHWMSGVVPRGDPRAPAKVVPKGLLSFDLEDARFFLALLPGPRRGDGLPESIRFWKDRIEALDRDRSFNVGLLYGPSGGGKSSFVKAGLAPNLDPARVCTAYLEATPTGTAARLLAELRRVAPSLPGDFDLAATIALLREDDRYRPARKLLLVIDQFEQWLQAHPQEPDALLVRALRQCDGARVQTLVLVRDDFWMAVTRFLRAVEVPLVQGGNAAAVELFDAPHARKVLEEFGLALGRLSELGTSGAAAHEASMFLDEVVAGLTAPDGRVIPMRLSLFTEVVRHRPWTRATLRAVGGVDGIGVKFLEDRFDSESSPHRVHRKAAQSILHALLPPPTSVIRGAGRTESDLRAASGYTDRPGDFDALLRVLDHELRLVASTDPPESTLEPPGIRSEVLNSGETHYQLAHDYLIRPVRQWLEKEKSSTRSGRARLRLELVAAAWAERPGPRRLPSPLEWVSILWHVPRAERSPEEQRLMGATARYYLSRGAAAAFVLAALALGGKMLRDRYEARSLLRVARAADDREFQALIPDLDPYRSYLTPELENILRTAVPDDHGNERARAGVLIYRFAPTPPRGQYLRALLLAAPDPDRVKLIREALFTHPESSGSDELWGVLAGTSAAAGQRLRAAAALARLAPEHPNWQTADLTFARALLGEDRGSIPGWIELLQPLLPLVVGQLVKDMRDSNISSSSRAAAAEAVAEALVLRGNDTDFAGPIAEAPPEAFHILVRGLKRCRDTSGAIAALGAILREPPDGTANEQRRDKDALRQASAAIALLALGQPEHVWPRLCHSADPRLRSFLIERLGRVDVSPQPLIDHLRSNIDSIELEGVLLALAEIKAPGESGLVRIAPQAVDELVSAARELYLEHGHPGVHSAAELLLRRWGHESVVRECDATLRKQRERPPGVQWDLAPNGHTMVIVSGPVKFRMGSPIGEDRRFPFENQHLRRIDHSFAVSTKEVTIEQFRKFDPSFPLDDRYTNQPSCPANLANWFHAARYCNWLSAQANIDHSQWCYPDKIDESSTTLTADSVERVGFRLPTEAEWEYLCRAMTETARPFGESEELLPRYAWTFGNSKDRAYPVGLLLPNEFGLFDILGNVWEWCHDGPGPGDATVIPPYPSGAENQPVQDRVVALSLEGASSRRMLRGGAFDYAPCQARSAHRYMVRPNLVEGTIGFRVVRTLPKQARRR
jgi:formylglycine-generating enzyme required for sulfatase activity